MARRVKAPTLAVPQSDQEAMDLLSAFVETERADRLRREQADAAIARIAAARDKATADTQAMQAHRFAALKAWWEAGGNALAGHRRAADLAGAKIGVRTGMPKLKMPKGMSPERIFELMRDAAYIRVKKSIDRAAIIQRVRRDPAMAKTLADAKIVVVQDDEFFIETGPQQASNEEMPG